MMTLELWETRTVWLILDTAIFSSQLMQGSVAFLLKGKNY